MKASRTGRIWAVIVATAIALLPAAPALAEGTEEGVPDEVILTAQDEGPSEEGATQDLADVATIAGADKICLYKEGGTPEIASMFRPQLKEENGGSFLEPGIDYELVDTTYDPDTETASISVKGVGAYTGQLTATMRTAPIKVTVADIPFDKAASPNTSDTVYETVSAKIDGEWVQLTRNTDYGVSFEGDLFIGANKPLNITGTGDYAGLVTDAATYRIVGDITKATVKVRSLTYTGKNLSPKITVTLPGGINKYYFMDQTLKAGTDYTVKYKNAKGADVTAVKNAGTYTAVITGKDCYKGTKNVKFTVAQKTNPLKASGKTVKVKLGVVAKAKRAIEFKNAITVRSAQGTVTYVKKSGNAKITINKTNGKITVKKRSKKGLKKGAYKVQIKVTAAGNTNYKKITKTVTVTIKVV